MPRSSACQILLALAESMSGTRAAPPKPIPIELFTSEGCSDCPAADVLWDKLITTQPVAGAEIIALEQHVDYWGRLGWRDRFGDNIYTPQMGP